MTLASLYTPLWKRRAWLILGTTLIVAAAVALAPARLNRRPPQFPTTEVVLGDQKAGRTVTYVLRGSNFEECLIEVARRNNDQLAVQSPLPRGTLGVGFAGEITILTHRALSCHQTTALDIFHRDKRVQ